MAALPTGIIKLSEVIQHFIDKGVGTFTKLSECIAVFDPASANSTYYPGGTVDRLSYFKGYDHITITLVQFSLTSSGYGPSSGACNDHTHVFRWHDGAGTYPVLSDIIYATNDVNDEFVGLNKYYGVYSENTTIKVNAAGIVLDKVVCPSAPDAPTNLASSAITSNSFTLSWTAPANNGGSTITDYKIYNGGGLPYTTTGNNNTSISITGLDPATTLTWTVKAVNAIGDSAPSTGLSVTTSALILTQFGIDIYKSGTSPTGACSALAGGWLQYYHNGSGSEPASGDIIYTTSTGSSVFIGDDKYYVVNTFGDGTPMKVDDNGVVVTVGTPCH